MQRTLNLPSRRYPHSCAGKQSGASNLRTVPAFSTPQDGSAVCKTAGPGAAASDGAPGKVDVLCAALVFATFATLAVGLYAIGALGEWAVKRVQATRRWLALQRVCSWCNQRLGGNPLAKTTHGICPQCLAEQKRQLGLYK